MALRVRWEGPFYTNQSLALVNRELSMRLAGSEELDLTIAPSDELSGEAWDPSSVERLRPLQLGASEPADISVRHQWPATLHAPKGEHWVMMQPWEYGSLPRHWYEPMKFGADQVWVYSSFNKQCYVESGIPADLLRVVPLGVPEVMLEEPPRRRSGGPFKFLFVGGTILRKGIDVLLDAYMRTFSGDDDVVLVIKDFGVGTYYRNQTHEGFIREIQGKAGAPRIEYISDDLPVTALRDLYRSCDCLVHPFRGEGFGLPVAEAMACGLPVIVPDEGGASDFCTPETAMLIPTVRKHMPANLARGLDTLSKPWWLEPNVRVLGDRMREMYEAPEKFTDMAMKGREKILSSNRWSHSAQSAGTFLEALGGPGSFPRSGSSAIQHQLRMQEGVESWGSDDRYRALRNFVQAAEYDRSADALYNIGSVLLAQRDYQTALEIFEDVQRTWGEQSPDLTNDLDNSIALCQEAISESEPLILDAPRIRWCAPIFNASGYASESRSFLNGLLDSDTDLGIQLVPHDPVRDNGLMSAPNYERLEKLVSTSQEIDVDFQHGPASAFTPPRAPLSVCRTMLETDRIPSDWVDRCNQFSQVWVPTVFNRETFIHSGVVPEKIRVVPGGIDASLYDPAGYPGLRTARDFGFCFFSVFDFTPRKGWDLLLRAYFEEFAADEDVCLVVKVVNFFGKGITADERIREFIAKNGYHHTASIVLIENECSDDELRRLYAGSDAFVLASRGEGWGRPYMEAMAFGLPTIGTRWSGNTEFMNDENSFLVDIDGLEPCERVWSDMPIYKGHQWAVPSLRSLRQRMREVFSDREAARQRGARARADVLARYDEPVVAGRFRSEIERLTNRSHEPQAV